MDEQEQKICPNCKREIPAVNFTIHSVHCARNIRVCPVCKEPVPQAELEDHHEKLHKLMPCKQCGEKVCGTDLEDHIRDSCGHTIKSCRYCELELPRREVPAHESYCGVRTEQCAQCREWVMIKYRQLHLDSNHGFLRLDDDPVPQPKKEPPKPSYLPKPVIAPKVTNEPQPSTSNGAIKQFTAVKDTNLLQNRPQTVIRYLGSPNDGPSTSNSAPSMTRPQQNSTVNARSIDNLTDNRPRSNGFDRPEGKLYNGFGGKVLKKRTNEQPQINTTVSAANKVDTQPISRGAVKKRPAPQPPRRPPTNDPKRELAYHSALLRSQAEERSRQEQSAYNLAHGLPPVLTPAAKLEKLRMMDALHNRETENEDYKTRLQGRVWMERSSVPAGNMLGSDERANTNHTHLEADRRRKSSKHRKDFNDLKPMSTTEFMEKFRELQLRKDKDDGSERRGDRFSEIKSSLQELRRGLNEVTAPYNANNPYNSEREPIPRSHEPDLGSRVFLPCEFCGAPVVADYLVQHQSGCRPDLAQYRPGSVSPHTPRSFSPLRVPVRGASSGPNTPTVPHPDPGMPVIPCEFCMQSLPVYLINEHQERCGRDSNNLYPD